MPPLLINLVNAANLALLRQLTRSEGFRLGDLVGLRRERLGKDAAVGLFLLFAVNIPFVVTMFALVLPIGPSGRL